MSDDAEPALSRRQLLAAGTTGLIATAAVPPVAGASRGRAGAADGTPEQIHLTWGADPARSVVVSWASPGQALAPRVRIGQRVIPAVERGPAAPRGGQVAWTYHALVDGLRPGATYGYAVTADNDRNAADPFSATFRTAPEGRAAFRFTSFGDLTAANARRAGGFGQSADAVGPVEAFQPLFHLLNADLADADLSPAAQPQAWRDFGNSVQASAANRPWMPVPGGHGAERADQDQALASYLARYSLPGNGAPGFEGRWYDFRVGTAAFLCLSGDDVQRGYSAGAQTRWLEATLAAARRDASVDWVVVQLHQCACASSGAAQTSTSASASGGCRCSTGTRSTWSSAGTATATSARFPPRLRLRRRAAPAPGDLGRQRGIRYQPGDRPPGTRRRRRAGRAAAGGGPRPGRPGATARPAPGSPCSTSTPAPRPAGRPRSPSGTTTRSTPTPTPGPVTAGRPTTTPSSTPSPWSGRGPTGDAGTRGSRSRRASLEPPRGGGRSCTVESMSAVDIVVVGAGVVGLTTAISLAEAGLSTRMVAAEPPSRVTSVAAGAIWGPVRCGPDDRCQEWARTGLEVLSALADEPSAGVHQLHGREVARAVASPPRWTNLLGDLRLLAAAELPAGFASGWSYTAPAVSMPAYLEYLLARYARLGGTVDYATVPVARVGGRAGGGELHRDRRQVAGAGRVAGAGARSGRRGREPGHPRVLHRPRGRPAPPTTCTRSRTATW